METQKRTLLKTAIYRGFTTIILFVASWFYTGNFIESSGITIVFNILATIFYYAHERMWIKTSWGIIQSNNVINTKNLQT